jgi:hypothetical protein
MNPILVTDFTLPGLTIFRDLRGGAIRDNLFVADSPKVVNLLLDETHIAVRSLLATPEYYKEHAVRIAARAYLGATRRQRRLWRAS